LKKKRKKRKKKNKREEKNMENNNVARVADVLPQVMGGGLPRDERLREREMAAGLGGPRPGEHNLHPGLAGDDLPHNGVQLPGR
jgi:hypothetical protein